jgi:hypothetical protein
LGRKERATKKVSNKLKNRPTAVVPLPESRRRNYQFRDPDIPILRKYSGERLELPLPAGTRVSDLVTI